MDVIQELLIDNTTDNNIVWATDSYKEYNKEDSINIKTDLILKIIKPRAKKPKDIQKDRTKKKGEVFTPIHVIKKMNDIVDEELKETHSNWINYVSCKVLEITCGEGSYITTRYDPITGMDIPRDKRVGLLDRKLEIVNKESRDYHQFISLSFKALKSVYGYEYQGDSLLIARMNIYKTFMEHLNHSPLIPLISNVDLIKEAINIITWNIIQMDGLSYTVPFSKKESNTQLDIFKCIHPEEYEPYYAKTYNWDLDKAIVFKDIAK